MSGHNIKAAVVQRLKNLDAFPKTLEDFRVKTFGGATVTVISTCLIIVLFVSELMLYLSIETQTELLVDTSRNGKIRIFVDIIFDRVPCDFLSSDAMDISGASQLAVSHTMYKKRLDFHGLPLQAAEKHEMGHSTPSGHTSATTLDPRRCESCYGAESPNLRCCNTCADVQEAYRLKGWAFAGADNIVQCKREGLRPGESPRRLPEEGCELYGFIEVNKVAGNIHFAPGRSYQQSHTHVHDLQGYGGAAFNMSHQIRHLAFGSYYPGMRNPLDDTRQVSDDPSQMYQYFLKVVPTSYEHAHGQRVLSNQFSATMHRKSQLSALFSSGSAMPGVFFNYEFSPMLVRYTERRKSFGHFLTGLCAIVGGVFTVASLVDAAIYHSARLLQEKIDLGKVS